MAGTFDTSAKCKVKFSLPELNYTAKISHAIHVTDQNSSYDLIIGRYLLSELAIILNFQNLTIIWENAVYGMKTIIYMN